MQTTIDSELGDVCGPLKFTITYDDTPVTDSTSPMSYETNNPKEIDVESDDTNLIDTTVPYKITVELENWPTAQHPDAPSLEVTKDVIYLSACPLSTGFGASTQNVADNGEYDNVEKTLTFVPHTLTPDYCQVDYTCDEVKAPVPTFGDCVSSGNKFTCDALTNDFTCQSLDGSDCSIKYTLDPADYENGCIPPGGPYEVCIEGCNPAALTETCEIVCIPITIEDPCDPPTSVTKPNYSD